MPRIVSMGTIVLTPVVALLLIAGTGLYLLISTSVDDFASRSIRDNLSSLSKAAYEVADGEIDRCDIKGLSCLDGAQKTIHQLAVFERFEDFAREHEVGLVVAVDETAAFVTGLEGADLKPILKAAPSIGVQRVPLSSSTDFYVRSIAFAPWNWHLILVKDATAFEALVAKVRAIYVGSGVALVLITLALVAWLRQVLVRPIYRIAGEFGEGRAPQYKGVKELEFLSDNIGGMMEALKAKTLHLETTLQSMSDGIAVFDADMRLVAWNEQYARLYRYPPELLRPGARFADIMRYNVDRGDYGPGVPDAQLAEIVERARKLDPPRFEIDRSDGTSMEVRRAPMPDGGFVTTYTDITDRKQAARLEIANEAKSQFLENVSHDLRKPVTAIIEDTRLLLDGSGACLAETQRRNLEGVQDSADHLLKMVDGLLEMSRIEAGQVEVKPEEVAVEAIVGQAVRVVEPGAKAKGLIIKAQVEDGLSAVTDPRLLSRILMNLAGNAVEYTDEGVIAVSALQKSDVLEISVSDTGVGVPEDMLDLVFEKFGQVEPTAGIAKPGTGLGLGLAIGREFARLLGGEISVESVPGEGSVFTVSIPIDLGGAKQ